MHFNQPLETEMLNTELNKYCIIKLLLYSMYSIFEIKVTF